MSIVIPQSTRICEKSVKNIRYTVNIVDRHSAMTTSVTLSEFESIMFPSILGKGSTLARTETSTWHSASPRRGDEVDPVGIFDIWVGDGEQTKREELREGILAQKRSEFWTGCQCDSIASLY